MNGYKITKHPSIKLFKQMNSNIINIMYDYTYLQRSIQMRLVDKKPYKDIVAELNGPIRSTISYWINSLLKDIRIIQRRLNNNRARVSKLANINVAVYEYINQLIYTNPYICRADVVNAVKQEYNITFSHKNITSIYRRLRLSYKKPKRMVVKNASYLNDLITNRTDFNSKIKLLDIDKIISIDESGFNSSSGCSKKGLSCIGKPLYIPTDVLKTKNISVLMAITSSDVLNHNMYDGAVNSNRFIDFIKDTITKIEGKGEYTFLFDNVSIHKNKNMLQIISDAGHKHIYTPPYSPNNNPIENVFSILKNNFNKSYDVDMSIKDNILNSINLLDYYTDSIFAKIFNRAFTITYQNIEKELKDRMHLI